MMLQYEGIYKARPLSWGLKPSERSKSQAVAIEFLITARFDSGNWEDLTQYEDQTITGFFYIVKKDGTVNTTQMRALAESLGWDGNPQDLLNSPPDVVCQVTVKNEEFDGKTRLKVQWINHESYTPGVQTAGADEVNAFGTQFGSLLRAAAAEGVAANKAMKPKREVPKPAPAPATAPSGGPDDEDDIPF